MTLSIDIQDNRIESHYAQCRDYLKATLSVVTLNVIIMSVVEPFYVVDRMASLYNDLALRKVVKQY